MVPKGRLFPGPIEYSDYSDRAAVVNKQGVTAKLGQSILGSSEENRTEGKGPCMMEYEA